MRCYFPRDVYSNIRNEFSQRCYLISDRGRYVDVRALCGTVSSESTLPKAEYRHRDCESNPIANLLADSRRRSAVRAVVFTLRIFFSRRDSALPFCSQVDQLSLYAMLLLFFFWRFYRVLRWEGVPFGKMFVLRASWRVCVATTSTRPIQNELWNFIYFRV